MQDYSWLKAPKPSTVTDADRAAFRMARADQHDAIAREWAERGDDDQAQRWHASAASLRGEA